MNNEITEYFQQFSGHSETDSLLDALTDYLDAFHLVPDKINDLSDPDEPMFSATFDINIYQRVKDELKESIVWYIADRNFPCLWITTRKYAQEQGWI
jgi:hypothetical protein